MIHGHESGCAALYPTILNGKRSVAFDTRYCNCSSGGGMPALTHVIPENDISEHPSDSLCPCMPRVFAGVAVHNSYDGREIGEVCSHALDLLGSALTAHGHLWTAEQRCEYEHAMHVLAMHFGNTEPRNR